MLREIKFRGKRVDKDAWVYGYLAIYTDGTHEITALLERIPLKNSIHQICRQSYEVDPESVGQYIGMTDSNDVEIYEGDILKVTDWNEYHTVEYFGEHGYPAFDFQDADCDCNALSHVTAMEQCYVVGNTFEKRQNNE